MPIKIRDRLHGTQGFEPEELEEWCEEGVGGEMGFYSFWGRAYPLCVGVSQHSQDTSPLLDRLFPVCRG
jgi:hypothetical protein